MNPITLLARLVLLVQLAYTIFIYRLLPAVIPNAYDGAGVAHRFAEREILWAFVALNFGLQLLMTFLTRRPQYFNLPAQPGDAERPRQIAIATALLCWVQLEVAVLFASFTWELAHEAPRHRGFPWVTPVIVGLVFVTTFLALWRMKHPARN